MINNRVLSKDSGCAIDTTTKSRQADGSDIARTVTTNDFSGYQVCHSWIIAKPIY